MKATSKPINNDQATQILQWNRTLLCCLVVGPDPSTLVAVVGFPLSVFSTSDPFSLSEPVF